MVMTLMMLLSFAACGGGGGGDDNPVDNNPQTLTGQFVDGPVQGLTYSTATQTGTTDANGNFKYVSGETVTFQIGDLIIGSAPGAAVISPVGLVENGTTSDAAVLNICRLLQSLDIDTDEATITIPTQILTNASSSSAQYYINLMDFADETSFDYLATNMLSVLTNDVPEYSTIPSLVDTTTALLHLENSLGVINTCDSTHLDLCTTNITCTGVGGTWSSDNTCNSNSNSTPSAPSEINLQATNKINANSFYNYFTYNAKQGETIYIHATLEKEISGDWIFRCGSTSSTENWPGISILDVERSKSCGNDFTYTFSEDATHTFYISYGSDNSGFFEAAVQTN